MGLPEFCVLVVDARPRLIVVADDLIPGDALVEPGGLVGLLIIDGFGPGMRAELGVMTLPSSTSMNQRNSLY